MRCAARFAWCVRLSVSPDPCAPTGWRRWRRAQEVQRSGAGLKTLDAWCAKSKEMKAIEDAAK